MVKYDSPNGTDISDNPKGDTMESTKVRASNREYDVRTSIVSGARAIIDQLETLISNSGRGNITPEMENLLKASAVRMHTEEAIACIADGSYQDAEKMLDEAKEIVRLNF